MKLLPTALIPAAMSIIVSMTLKELDALQTKMLQHPKNKFKSSAAGR